MPGMQSHDMDLKHTHAVAHAHTQTHTEGPRMHPGRTEAESVRRDESIRSRRLLFGTRFAGDFLEVALSSAQLGVSR